MFQFLRKAILTILLAALASQANAMFIQADWLDPRQPNVGTNRYAYSHNDPINKLDPSGNTTVVTDKDDNDLFSLDDNSDDETRITAQDAYDKGIQWFEKDADNYMKLIDVNPGFTSHDGIKHFTWSDIANFSDKDRYSVQYRSGGAGDWKASAEGASKYLVSDVDGAPYWSDALGQIPFAADTYRSYRKDGYSHEEAAQMTAERGAQFSEGSIVKGLAAMSGLYSPDISNSYDNKMISRTTDWANSRWSFTAEGNISTNWGVLYSNLSYWRP